MSSVYLPVSNIKVMYLLLYMLVISNLLRLAILPSGFIILFYL